MHKTGRLMRQVFRMKDKIRRAEMLRSSPTEWAPLPAEHPSLRN